MTILVIAEHDNDNLADSTLHTITAAQQIGDSIQLLIAGHNCQKVANIASSIANIDKVLLADDGAYATRLAENMASLIVKIAAEYTHILSPATTFGKDITPRVAALLNVEQISDIIQVINHNTFKRPFYAGNAIASITSTANIHVITVRTTGFERATTNDGNVDIVTLNHSCETNLATFLKDIKVKSERPSLTSAKVVISGGRGLGNADNFKLLYKLADKLNAAVGASRAAVDAGFVSNDMQVGQTGQVVAPELYIAVGISGAIQHLAGMKESGVIVAINKDADAPIFQIADYGIVGDLFTILPELTEKI